MQTLSNDRIRTTVRQHYGEAVKKGTNCCGSGAASASSCCTTQPVTGGVSDGSRCFTYPEEDVRGLPQGSYLALGCGNPVALGEINRGETVLDLGSGAGVDCFLASRQVGEEGHVIGVDMTPEMLSKARENAVKGGCGNVEFRLGEIEHLPVADASVDVVISNCVINLSPDKPRVLSEIYRVLKPGGRLAVADMIAQAPLPAETLGNTELYCACIAGAAPVEDLRTMLTGTGFHEVKIRLKGDAQESEGCSCAGATPADLVQPALVTAVKPIDAQRP
ncbi:MAG: arsenite methyltransferase [Pseudomonadota bacterium]